MNRQADFHPSDLLAAVAIITALKAHAKSILDIKHSLECPPHDYHNDFGSVRVSIEGRGSPPILASKPRNR